MKVLPSVASVADWALSFTTFVHAKVFLTGVDHSPSRVVALQSWCDINIKSSRARALTEQAVIDSAVLWKPNSSLCGQLGAVKARVVV